MSDAREYAGTLRRDAGGFELHGEDGRAYRLVLLRTPVDEVEKRVVVTGVEREDGAIEAEGVRLA